MKYVVDWVTVPADIYVEHKELVDGVKCVAIPETEYESMQKRIHNQREELNMLLNENKACKQSIDRMREEYEKLNKDSARLQRHFDAQNILLKYMTEQHKDEEIPKEIEEQIKDALLDNMGKAVHKVVNEIKEILQGKQ